MSAAEVMKVKMRARKLVSLVQAKYDQGRMYDPPPYSIELNELRHHLRMAEESHSSEEREEHISEAQEIIHDVLYQVSFCYRLKCRIKRLLFE